MAPTSAQNAIKNRADLNGCGQKSIGAKACKYKCGRAVGGQMVDTCCKSCNGAETSHGKTCCRNVTKPPCNMKCGRPCTMMASGKCCEGCDGSNDSHGMMCNRVNGITQIWKQTYGPCKKNCGREATKLETLTCCEKCDGTDASHGVTCHRATQLLSSKHKLGPSPPVSKSPGSTSSPLTKEKIPVSSKAVRPSTESMSTASTMSTSSKSVRIQKSAKA